MKTLLLSILIFAFLAINSSAQDNALKATLYPSGKDSFETIVFVNVKHSKGQKYLDVMSIVKKIYFKGINGQPNKISTKDIDSLKITDFGGESYVFNS